jgi:hypothetical protein
MMMVSASGSSCEISAGRRIAASSFENGMRDVGGEALIYPGASTFANLQALPESPAFSAGQGVVADVGFAFVLGDFQRHRFAAN